MLAIHIGVGCYFLIVAKRHQNQVAQVHYDLFGLMRKIEGLSSSKRALVQFQLDSLLETLIKQLPTRIATQAGEQIFDTESQMLRALSELGPDLKGNIALQQRLEALVQSMGNLESTIVSLTNETVRQAMLDAKHLLLRDEHVDLDN